MGSVAASRGHAREWLRIRAPPKGASSGRWGGFQRARFVQNKIGELNAKLVQYRMHAAVEARRNNQRLVGIFSSLASGIEARIADLQRQAADIRITSIESYKEMEDINAKLEDHWRQFKAAQLGEHQRARPASPWPSIFIGSDAPKST